MQTSNIKASTRDPLDLLIRAEEQAETAFICGPRTSTQDERTLRHAARNSIIARGH